MKTRSTMLRRVEAYLAFRRHLGFLLRIEGKQLLQFARFADAEGHRGPLTTELALRWATLPGEASKLYHARRLEVVRCFARYQIVHEPRTEIPPARLLGRAHRRTQPHLYTPAELRTLLRAAGRLDSTNGMRPRTYRVLLGLLACTGLRISEALHLRRADFDPNEGTLLIRRTKFRKRRWVPLHPTTVATLKEYLLQRETRMPHSACDRFFVNDRGRALAYSTVRHTFRQLARPIPTHPGSTRRPRLHDLRHTFACERLTRWYREGKDVTHAVASLSTYLGHAKPSDTYWYLTVTPELMAEVSSRFERFRTKRRAT